MIEIRFHGRGGQGAVTAARILATAFAKEGKDIFVLPDFTSERRSAPMKAFLRVDEETILLRSKIYEPNYLFILDKTLLKLKNLNILEGFKNGGFAIINALKTSEELRMLNGSKIAICDANSIARKYKLGPAALPAVGTILLGAFVKATGLISLKSLLEAVRESEELPKKEENLKAIEEIFEIAEVLSTGTSCEGIGQTTLTSTLTPLPESTISLGDTLSDKTGSWRTERPFFETKVSPCSHACPAHENIREWLNLLGKRKFQKAWQVLVRTNPLPAVCAMVCQGFCESNCNRKEFDEAVAINTLERLLGERALKRHWKVEKPEVRISSKVAVVGSGPAGLSAASKLVRYGYEVTVFEKAPVLGGMLRLGIPEFRLPKSVLEKEIENNILSLGIEVKKNVEVDELTLSMISERFDAVFVAVGLQKSRKLNIPGENMESVFNGLDFLKKINLGERVDVGEKVMVVGGGNTGIDVAIVAKLLGAKEILIVELRKEEDVAVVQEEKEMAKKEGIEIKYLVNLLKIEQSQNRLKAVCQKMSKTEETQKLIPIENSEFIIDKIDTIFVAIGQESDVSFIDTKQGNIFFGGDVTTRAGTVAAAIGSGEKAAELIDRFLKKENVPQQQEEAQVVGAKDLNLAEIGHKPRVVFDRGCAEELIGEAKRCFSCGKCNLCGVCWKFCPHFSILEKEGKMEINYDYCKGCGICAQECPRAVISKKLEE